MNGSASRQNVSVMGLGFMGSALAAALLTAGHKVTVWNRTATKAEPLVDKGARPAASATEAVGAGDATLLCVTNCAAAIEVLDGIAVGPDISGKPLVLLSSMTEAEAPSLERAADRLGIACLVGSILGVPDNVAGGTATIITSGPRKSFDDVEPVLRAFGSANYLSADPAAACSFDKVWFAYVYGVHAAFFQGAALAHAKGFALDAYLDTVKARTPALVGQCMAFGEKIAARDHPASMGRLEVWAEPLDETLAMCRCLGVNDGLPAAISDNFRRAVASGRGDQELSAIFEMLIEQGQN